MEFNATLELNSLNEILRARGLQDGGKVQKYIDNEVMQLMTPFMPKQQGDLINAMQSGTVVGSGIIVTNAPQAKFLYYGNIMIGEKSRSAWARANEKKIVKPDKPNQLTYSQAENAKAGPLWFNQMENQHKDDILRGAARVAGAEAVMP